MQADPTPTNRTSIRTTHVRLTPLLIPLVVAACATSPRQLPSGVPPAPVTNRTLADTAPASLRWTRSAAEHRALFLEIYRNATTAVEQLSVGEPKGRWGVIMDADETVLDNAQYEQERARIGQGYSAQSWADWVRRQAAPALPGAAAFVERVHSLGGRVAIVTNRDESVCGATRNNLAQDGIAADLVLCQPSGAPGDKNPRFQAVIDGTASPAVPPLDVVMWVGDNIQDFPRLDQSIRLAKDSAFVDFGRRFVILPNPMYGSWEKNPLP